MEILALHKNDDSQTISLPKSLAIDDQKVYAKKVVNAVLLIPFHYAWNSLFASLESFSDDFMIERNQPAQQTRSNL